MTTTQQPPKAAALARAVQIIQDAEASLRRDLLMDNTCWDSIFVRAVVDAVETAEALARMLTPPTAEEIQRHRDLGV